MHLHFEEIYKKYYALLYSVIQNIVLIHEEREEIVQDVFLGYWNDNGKTEIHTSLKAYLCKAAINKALNHKKRNSIIKQHHQEIFHNATTSVENNLIVEKEKIQIVRTEIEKLPPQCKQVYKMSRYDEMSQLEIAEKLGISIKTVKAHIGKALK
jgi:RNA polymerase sigma-70 factor (ECF subfamily)